METDKEAYAAGVEAAAVDIAAGRLIYRWTGHAGHWGHWIVTELPRRFGVGVDNGFGVCLVTQWSVSFNDGYNATLAAEINRRHGDSAFEAVFTDARHQSEEALADARRAWLEKHVKL